MRIIQKQIGKWPYCLEYDYDLEVVRTLQSLKESLNDGSLSYVYGRWRANSMRAVDAVVSTFPDSTLEGWLMAELDMYRNRMREKAERMNNALIIKGKKGTDFEVDYIKGKLYDYQKVTVEFIKNADGRALVFHSPGVGKSACALGYIVHMGFAPAVIVCPASVKSSWKNEILKWTDLKPLVVNSDWDGYWGDADVAVVNYDILHKFLDELKAAKPMVMVVDESHMVKAATARRTKCVQILSASIPRQIFLTGTPMMNRPAELFTILNMVDPVEFPDWWGYAHRYCDPVKKKVGWDPKRKQPKYAWDFKGSSNMEELANRISHMYIRRTKDEVLKELPPKVWIDMPVSLDPDSKRKYDRVEKLAELDGVGPGEALTVLGELRQLASLGKVEAAIEAIESRMEDDKVLCFSCYNEPLRQIRDYFGEKAVYLTGEVPQGQREEIIRRFQEDPECRVFLGGYQSGGVGITLTAARTTLLLDFSFVPSDIEQATNRNHRPGVEHDSLDIIQMYAEGTIDDKMRMILEHKKDVFRQIFENGGDGSEVMMSELLKIYGKK